MRKVSETFALRSVHIADIWNILHPEIVNHVWIDDEQGVSEYLEAEETGEKDIIKSCVPKLYTFTFYLEHISGHWETGISLVFWHDFCLSIIAII